MTYRGDSYDHAEDMMDLDRTMRDPEWQHPPFITPKTDGPMLVMSNGQPYYLTFIERVLWVLGFTTPEKLEAKHRH